MPVTILGEYITLIRPHRIHKPQLPKKVWKNEIKNRPRLVKHTIEEMQKIAMDMGYAFKTK